MTDRRARSAPGAPRAMPATRLAGRSARAPLPAGDGPDLLHLVRRTTFGPTPALLADARARGAQAWLARQLAPATVPDPVCDAVVARWPALRLSTTQVRAEVAAGRLEGWRLMWSVVQATIARACWSERQLFEVMAGFWSDHLAVSCPSDNVWDSRHRYDADVVRRHALGRFADLLGAALTHPAMLRYLTNESSRADHPNENLGRELLELHTVGVDAGYTEADVLDAARVLTGMSVDDDTGEFRYRPRWHWTGRVRVLGFEHANADPAGGPAVVAALAAYLARRPETARRIARKLAVRFVADDPPAAFVDRLAATYLARDTAVVPVLAQLFSSPEFAASAGAKVRRPYEDVVATVRALGLRPDASGVAGIEGLGWMVNDLGHCPLGWPTPDGFPDVAAAWSSPAAKLGLWNAHLSLAAGWWPSTLQRDPLAALVPAPRPATHGALVDALAARLLAAPVTAAQRAAVCTFLEVTPSTPLRADSEALGWRLRDVVALVLDTPQHAVR